MLALAVAAVLLALAPAPVCRCDVFTVTSTADSGSGSLREALGLANTRPGRDVVVLRLPPGAPTITLSSALPHLSDPLDLDGGSSATTLNVARSADYGLVLDRGADGSRISALTVTAARLFNIYTLASDLVLTDLVVTAAQDDGVRIAGNRTVLANSTVSGCGDEGVQVDGFANAVLDTRIGGCSGDGLSLLGGSNTVRGCRIGLAADGASCDGNGRDGILLSASSTGGDNQIGGPDPAHGNTIVCNTREGLASFSAHPNNLVAHNYIGLGPDGASALSNGMDGIYLSPTTTDCLLADNVVAANPNSNIYMYGTRNSALRNTVGTDARGVRAITPSTNFGLVVATGATDILVQDNLISGHTHGILVTPPNARIINNICGLNSAGNASVPNTSTGIYLNTAASGTLVANNTCSGNGEIGIYVLSAQNRLVGNTLGASVAAGASVPALTPISLPNGLDGVFVAGEANYLADNILSGNARHGVVISSPHNTLVANIAGSDRQQATVLENKEASVFVDIGADNNTLEHNVIAHGATGLELFSSHNTFLHNHFPGTRVLGLAMYETASNNTVAYTTFGSHITDLACRGSSNHFHHNFFGLAADESTNLGFSLTGLSLEDGASDNKVFLNVFSDRAPALELDGAHNSQVYGNIFRFGRPAIEFLTFANTGNTIGPCNQFFSGDRSAPISGPLPDYLTDNSIILATNISDPRCQAALRWAVERNSSLAETVLAGEPSSASPPVVFALPSSPNDTVVSVSSNRTTHSIARQPWVATGFSCGYADQAQAMAFLYTPPRTGDLVLNTSGSDFDAAIGLFDLGLSRKLPFDPSSVDSLQQALLAHALDLAALWDGAALLACNDDAPAIPAGQALPSSYATLRHPVAGSHTYMLVVALAKGLPVLSAPTALPALFAEIGYTVLPPQPRASPTAAQALAEEVRIRLIPLPPALNVSASGEGEILLGLVEASLVGSSGEATAMLPVCADKVGTSSFWTVHQASVACRTLNPLHGEAVDHASVLFTRIALDQRTNVALEFSCAGNERSLDACFARINTACSTQALVACRRSAPLGGSSEHIVVLDASADFLDTKVGRVMATATAGHLDVVALALPLGTLSAAPRKSDTSSGSSDSSPDARVVVYANLGSSNGAFSSPITVSNNVSYARGLKLVDMDGDARLDAVVFSARTPALAWLRNQGYNTPWERIAIPVPASCVDIRSLDVFDADGDGDNDVLVACHGGEDSNPDSGMIVLAFNDDEHGTFTAGHETVLYVGGQPAHVHAADVDHDGRPDIVFSTDARSQHLLAWLPATSPPGTFGPAQFLVSPPQSASKILALALDTDVNADGQPDLLTITRITTSGGAFNVPVVHLAANRPPYFVLTGTYPFYDIAAVRPVAVDLSAQYGSPTPSKKDVVLAVTLSAVGILANVAAGNVGFQADNRYTTAVQDLNQIGAIEVANLVSATAAPEILVASSGQLALYKSVLQKVISPARLPLPPFSLRNDLSVFTRTQAMVLCELDGDLSGQELVVLGIDRDHKTGHLVSFLRVLHFVPGSTNVTTLYQGMFVLTTATFLVCAPVMAAGRNDLLFTVADGDLAVMQNFLAENSSMVFRTAVLPTPPSGSPARSNFVVAPVSGLGIVDLLTMSADGTELRLHRNLGSGTFSDAEMIASNLTAAVDAMQLVSGPADDASEAPHYHLVVRSGRLVSIYPADGRRSFAAPARQLLVLESAAYQRVLSFAFCNFVKRSDRPIAADPGLGRLPAPDLLVLAAEGSYTAQILWYEAVGTNSAASNGSAHDPLAHPIYNQHHARAVGPLVFGVNDIRCMPRSKLVPSEPSELHDILVALRTSSEGPAQVAVHANAGNRNFYGWQPIVPDVESSGVVVSYFWGLDDLNADGSPDFVRGLVNTFMPTKQIWWSAGTAPARMFGSLERLAIAAAPNARAVYGSVTLAGECGAVVTNSGAGTKSNDTLFLARVANCTSGDYAAQEAIGTAVGAIHAIVGVESGGATSLLVADEGGVALFRNKADPIVTRFEPRRGIFDAVALALSVGHIDALVDQNLDVLVGTTDSLLWLRGVRAAPGEVAFEALPTSRTLAAGDGPVYAAVLCDVNSDGLLDALAALFEDGLVVYFEGDGEGFFSVRRVLLSGLTNPRVALFDAVFASVGESNEEADASAASSTLGLARDVLSASVTGEIVAARALGGGRFERQTTVASGLGTDLQSVVMVDVAGSTLLDLCVTTASPSQVLVLEALGNGKYARARIISTTLADPKQIFPMLFWKTNTSSYQPVSATLTGSPAITPADWELHVNLLVAGSGSGMVSVYSVPPAQTATAPDAADTGASPLSLPYCAQVAASVLFFPTCADGQCLTTANADGSCAQPQHFPAINVQEVRAGSSTSEAAVRGLTAVDLDGDGLPEAILDTRIIYRNVGGTLVPGPSLNDLVQEKTSYIIGTLVMDLNSDPFPDLVVIEFSASFVSGSLAGYINDGHGNFNASGAMLFRFPFDAVVGMTACDIDGNGKRDLVFSDRGRGGLYVMYFQGDMSYSLKQEDYLITGSLACVRNPESSRRKRLVVVVGQDQLQVYSYERRSIFSSGYELLTVGKRTVGADSGDSTFNKIETLSATDINGDGLDDLVVEMSSPDRIIMLEALDSSGSRWAEHVVVSTTGTGFGEVGLGGFAVADFTGDGLLDLAAYYNGRGWLLESSEAQKFVFAATELIGKSNEAVRGFVAADMNGDGDLDLLAISKSSTAASDPIVYGIFQNTRRDVNPPVAECFRQLAPVSLARTAAQAAVDPRFFADDDAALRSVVIHVSRVGAELGEAGSGADDNGRSRWKSLQAAPPTVAEEVVHFNQTMTSVGGVVLLGPGTFNAALSVLDAANNPASCVFESGFVVKDPWPPVIEVCATNVVAVVGPGSNNTNSSDLYAPIPRQKFDTFFATDNTGRVARAVVAARNATEPMFSELAVVGAARDMLLAPIGSWAARLEVFDDSDNAAQCFFEASVLWQSVQRLQLFAGSFVSVPLITESPSPSSEEAERGEAERGEAKSRFSFAFASEAPLGLSLGVSTGVLVGTPLVSQTLNVTVRVCDSRIVPSAAATTVLANPAACASASYAVSIAPFVVTWALPTTGRGRTRREPLVEIALPAAILGVPYSFSANATLQGGSDCLTYELVTNSGYLPDGMVLLETGELAGTPREVGRRFAFQIRAIDASGVSALVTNEAGQSNITLAVQDCGEGSCLNGGSCVDDVAFDGLYACNCTGLWSGVRCETPDACSAGTELVGGVCVVCKAGTTDDDLDAETPCVVCGEGTFAPTGSKAPCSELMCLAGTVDDDRDPTTPCERCGAGRAVPRNSSGGCDEFVCAAGTTDHDGDAATACVVCPPGVFVKEGSVGPCEVFECGGGQTDADSNPATPCVDCGVGHFSTNGSSGGCEEYLCDFATLDHDEDASTPCRALCGAGHWVVRGAYGKCDKYSCPGGWTDHDGDPYTQCVECGPGVYAASGSSGPCARLQCAAGSVDDDSNAATECVGCEGFGFYVPAGTFGETCNATQFRCREGEVDADNDPSTPCVAVEAVLGCGDGFEQVAMANGTKVCRQCPAGWTDDDGVQDTPCVQCVAGGLFVPAGSTGACEEKKFRCVAGTLDNDFNTSTPCVQCGSGLFVPEGRSGACAMFACLAGTTDHDSDPASPCLRCRIGTYVRAGSVGECDDYTCPSGWTDADNDPATDCVECGPGHFTRDGESGPCELHRCDFGTIDEDSNATTGCKAACPAGHFVVPRAFGSCDKYACAVGTTDHDRDTTTVCVACGEGVFAARGSSGPCVLHSCPAGWIDDDRNASTPCVQCERGAFVPPGQAGNCSAFACGEGEVDPDNDAATPCVDVLAVTGCGDGFEETNELRGVTLANGTVVVETVVRCRLCPAGSTDDDGESTTSCRSCAGVGGVYVPPGSSGPCEDVDRFGCAAGTVDDDSDPSTPCVACAAGTFVPRGRNGTCDMFTCPAGTSDHDSSPASPCLTCRIGTYTKPGTIGLCEENACPAGETDADLSAATPCVKCGVGHYTRAGASGPCSEHQCDFGTIDHDLDPTTGCKAVCTAGHFVSPKAAGSCERYVCQAGATDHDLDTTTACVACGPGTFVGVGYSGTCASHNCSAGTIDHDSDPKTECVVCSKGTFVPAGQTGACEAFACPPDTANNRANEPCVATAASAASGGASNLLLYGVAAGAGVLVLSLLLVLLIIRKRKKREQALKRQQMEDLKARVTATVQSLVPGGAAVLQAKMRRLELPRNMLDMGEKLGEGEFGDVVKAKLNSGEAVAVKQVKAGVDEDQQERFLVEAWLTACLQHPYIVTVYAICSESTPFLAALEFLPGGNLRDFLRERGPRMAARRGSKESQMGDRVVGAEELLVAGRHLASALAFLEEKKVVHRDLAARNVLVGANVTQVKLADFGMSRAMEEKDYYRKTSDDKVPVKWMAPESIQEKVYSHKTDVWSFGVVLWEMFSFGAPPFAELTAVETALAVGTGKRMKRPAFCPEPLYAMMLYGMWAVQAEDRPTFLEVEGEISRLERAVPAGARERGWTAADSVTLELDDGAGSAAICKPQPGFAAWIERDGESRASSTGGTNGSAGDREVGGTIGNRYVRESFVRGVTAAVEHGKDCEGAGETEDEDEWSLTQKSILAGGTAPAASSVPGYIEEYELNTVNAGAGSRRSSGGRSSSDLVSVNASSGRRRRRQAGRVMRIDLGGVDEDDDCEENEAEGGRRAESKDVVQGDAVPAAVGYVDLEGGAASAEFAAGPVMRMVAADGLVDVNGAHEHADFVWRPASESTT